MPFMPFVCVDAVFLLLSAYVRQFVMETVCLCAGVSLVSLTPRTDESAAVFEVTENVFYEVEGAHVCGNLQLPPLHLPLARRSHRALLPHLTNNEREARSSVKT